MADIELGSTVWIMVRGRRSTKHNRKIGTFASTHGLTGHKDEMLPFLPNPDSGVLSPFMMTLTANYTVEFNLEMHRRLYFPHRPSRLGCVFVFDEADEAYKTVAQHGWRPDMFETAKVTTLLASHRGDMSIVTHLRHLFANSMTDPVPFMNAYWRGEPCLSYELQKFWSQEWERTDPQPIWETLIDGAITFDAH